MHMADVNLNYRAACRMAAPADCRWPALGDVYAGNKAVTMCMFEGASNIGYFHEVEPVRRYPLCCENNYTGWDFRRARFGCFEIRRRRKATDAQLPH